jgi:hypothetical protein
LQVLARSTYTGGFPFTQQMVQMVVEREEATGLFYGSHLP